MDLLYLWCIIGVILQRTVNGQQLVSQGKPITSSSQHKTWSADKAVDGDKRQTPNVCDCCAATNQDQEPWFVLDLEQTYRVQRINVIGRTGYQTLRQMEIKLGTSQEGGTVLTKDTGDVQTYDYVLPSPQFGRYITLTLRGISEYFVICELEVYAECSGNTYGNPCVPCGNCLNGDPCDKTDGSCQACAAGYQETKCDQHCKQHMYGPGCTSECGECENDVTCNNVNGTCVGCKTGYMAPMCKDCSNSYNGNTCNERCYCAVGFCDTSTGVCPAGGCTAGYKGNRCDTVCDSNMWGKDCQVACGNCLNDVQCDVSNGRCPRGCSAGYKGQFCTEPCEDGKYGRTCMSNCGNCLNNATCDKQDGRCDSCAAGYKGDKCLDNCKQHMYGPGCTSVCGECENDVTCNNVNGTCVGCKTGYMAPMCKDCSNSYHGNTCNERCYCAVGSCDTSTGVCPAGGCTAGYKGNRCDTLCDSNMWGKDCQVACGKCLNDVQCDVFNGRCTGGCSAGYKGQFCTELCDSNMWGKDCQVACGYCLNDVQCDVFNGRCPGGCSAGYKGQFCTEPCEDGKYGPTCMANCGNCLNNATCDKQDGRCDSCAAGYKDNKCLDTCGNGSYGLDCLMSCGNCLGGETCNAETGICGNGCTEGFNGTFCNISCPAETFGRNCVSRCGNCFQGVACRNTDGQCEDGCEPGYKEPTCKIECENGTFGRGCQPCGSCIGEPCDKFNGTCQECALGYSLHNCTLYEGQSDGPGGGGGGGSAGLIARAVGGIIGVIVLVVVGVILYKRRSPKGKFADPKPEFSAIGNSSQPVVKKDPPVITKPKPTVQTHNEQSTSHTQKSPPTDQETEDLYYSFLSKKTDLKICQLWDYIHLKKREESLMFHQEFSRLANGLIKPHKTAMLADNRGKNRYKGLYAYDHTRVPLSIEAAGEVDYINASFIDGFERPKKFIASQGPIKTMVVDFWRMVWQQMSGNIVMLTNIMENGTEKCMLYWPKEVGTDVTHGNITIRLMSEKKTPDYTSRHFNISEVDGEYVLPVDQFHYQAWPDKSIPDSTWSLVKFWLEVTKKTSRDNVNTPIVVHCSAGIGRTGTFIAMDVAYHSAKSKGTLKMLDVVTSLREQRVNMVQTKGQYVYVHEAVADMFHFGTHFIWTSQFEEVYEYLSESDIGSRCSRLQEQYNLIVESIADRKSVQLNNGNENDEYINITILQRPATIPVDDYRPKSKSTVYVQEARALILQNHEEKDAFIICKSPTESRMKEFWSLVKEQNVKTIISLAPQSASKKSLTLGLENKMIQENFRLSLDQKRKTSAFLETIVKMADSSDDNHVVSHFEYTHWGYDGNVPTDTISMIQLLEAVMDRQSRLSSTEPILVYCTNGVKQSGLVSALLSEINRINREGGHVNIIHTVKTMKERNDDVVGTFDQYQYIHDVILARIKDSTYQNQ